MVDLVGQYQRIKPLIDKAIGEVIDSAKFIKGPSVQSFEENLSQYLQVKHVISCANGTDALQVALMALELEEGDEVILPAFTYPATVEVVVLLKLKPVLVDVDIDTFNISADAIEEAITNKTKAILPVHLYGQSADLPSIMSIAKEKGIAVIEDNAQAMGTKVKSSNSTFTKTGTLGNIGTTSFFPTKNLACYGDGGAIFTNDDDKAKRIRMICNHGQEKKYYHSIVGVNSRLDSLQAAVLNIKLQFLSEYLEKRQEIAKVYDKAFKEINEIEEPTTVDYSTHTYHQYTLKIKNQRRDELKSHLSKSGIPSVVYYPIPIHKQKAYANIVRKSGSLKNSEALSSQVLSLPIHTELNDDAISYIIENLTSFFK